MLTIGIIFCDKDYENVSKMLEQIENNVKAEHEVITIDNREDMLDVELDFTPTFSFGYNAFQSRGRKKIVELAKGDYIWFVDGDDEIIGLEKTEFDKDVYVFSVKHYHGLVQFYEEKDYEGNLLNGSFYNYFLNVLWNKIIKKSVLEKFIFDISDDKIVSLEDGTIVLGVLKYAKTARTEREVIYLHNKGFSNAETASVELMQNIFTGFESALKNIDKIIGETDFDVKNVVVKPQARYLFRKIDFNGDISLIEQLLDILIPSFDRDIVYDLWHKQLAVTIKTKNQYELVKDVLRKYFPDDDFFYKVIVSINHGFDKDGNPVEEEIKRYVDPINFDE